MNTPERTCLGCRQRAPKAELVRLAWNDQDGTVVVDHRQRLPGRGAYLHPACTQLAVKKLPLGRALRRPVDPEQAATVLAAQAAPGAD